MANSTVYTSVCSYVIGKGIIKMNIRMESICHVRTVHHGLPILP